MHLISRSPICIIDLKIRAILALGLKLSPSVLQARNDQGHRKSKSDYPLVYFKTITKKIRRFIGEISLKMWLCHIFFKAIDRNVQKIGNFTALQVKQSQKLLGNLESHDPQQRLGGGGCMWISHCRAFSRERPSPWGLIRGFC